VRDSTAWAAAALATAVATCGAVGAAQQRRAEPERLSFAEALRAASAEAGDRVPAEITLLEGDPPRYEVLFLVEDGTESFEIDAVSGAVRQRERVELGARFRQNLRRLMRASDVTLADAVAMAERHVHAPLVRVLFQAYRGELVVEAQALEDGAVIGFVLDPETGREIVGAPQFETGPVTRR
jgi:hypothetical protein